MIPVLLPTLSEVIKNKQNSIQQMQPSSEGKKHNIWADQQCNVHIAHLIISITAYDAY